MGVICDNTYSAISSLSSVATDSSMTGNGTVESPLGCMRQPVELLWSGVVSSVGYTAALPHPITDYQYIDMLGSGSYTGPAYTRLPVSTSFPITTTLYTVSPAENVQARFDFQRISFVNATSFSAGSGGRFGMTGGATGYQAANNINSSVYNTRMTALYGVGYASSRG